ncbi:hypothetical protein [Desulfobotulus sp.]|nr:hypothetical protein [Desulfobotulus sp.]MDY0162130.1 hypothetical protein [Desulfobotulus sp.]
MVCKHTFLQAVALCVFSGQKIRLVYDLRFAREMRFGWCRCDT